MTKALLVLMLVLASACAALVFVAKARKRRAEKAEAEAKSLRKDIWEVEQRAERLQKALDGNFKAEEKADEKRKDLAATADPDLARRANGLFGVRDNPESSPRS